MENITPVNTEKTAVRIDLLETLDNALKNKWLILLISLIMAVLGFIYCTLFKVPTYTATTQVYILNSVSESISYSDMQTSIQLTSDYEKLITNVSVTEKVIDKLNLSMSPAALASKISVASPEDTRILVISVTDRDPFMAKQIADAVREVASEKILDIMRIDAVKLVNEARVPTASTSNGATKTAMTMFLISLVLCIGVIAIINIFDDSVKSPDDIERYFGISLLGSIPVEKMGTTKNIFGIDGGEM